MLVTMAKKYATEIEIFVRRGIILNQSSRRSVLKALDPDQTSATRDNRLFSENRPLAALHDRLKPCVICFFRIIASRINGAHGT